MTNPELSTQDVLGPISLGLTTDKLLTELEEVFPEQSPQFNEKYEKLMWRGGQRDVVRWIRSRLMEESVQDDTSPT
jgi:hypothetical protein